MLSLIGAESHWCWVSLMLSLAFLFFTPSVIRHCMTLCLLIISITIKYHTQPQRHLAFSFCYAEYCPFRMLHFVIAMLSVICVISFCLIPLYCVKKLISCQIKLQVEYFYLPSAPSCAHAESYGGNLYIHLFNHLEMLRWTKLREKEREKNNPKISG